MTRSQLQLALGLGLDFCRFCHSVFDLFAFAVFCFVFFQYKAKKLVGKNVSEMAYFVSSGTWNVDSSNHSRTAGLCCRCRAVSAAAGLTEAISSQHLLQIASEDFVAWCVDERIHAEAEVSQWTGQHKSVAVQGRNLPDVQQSNLSMRMCFTLKLLQEFASKAAYRPNSTGSLGPVPRNFR